VLKTVEDLHALDELGVLLQSQHRRRSPGQPSLPHQPAVGIGRAQSGLDHPLQSHRACHRQPCRAARVVHLQRHRWLTQQQPPPPAAQQALVQRLEHPHHRLHARFVSAIRLHSHPHVAPTASSVPAGDRRESSPREDQHNKESRQKNSTGGPIPGRARLTFQSARQRVERNVRDVQRCGSSQRRGWGFWPSQPGTRDRHPAERGFRRRGFSRRSARYCGFPQSCPEAAIEQPSSQGKGHENGEQAQGSPQQEAEHLVFLLRPPPANGTAAPTRGGIPLPGFEPGFPP
jgi:hypothetical protein